MAGNLQPLDQKFPIVDENGRPSLYFIKWAQQRQLDISQGITEQDLLDYLLTHKLQEGIGIQITPSGNLSDSPTIAADVQEILDTLSATRGVVIFRGLTGWTVLLPGTSGQFLKTNGPGADPQWATPSGGGGGGGTPTIRSRAIYSYNATTYNAVFPAGTVAGDLVVAMWENGFNGMTGVPTQAGWTTLSVRNDGWTNGAAAAKVMTAGDIATGFVTVTSPGGAFNGVAALVTLQAGTFTALNQKTDFCSVGSGSVASWAIGGLYGSNTTDTIFGLISTRGAMNIGVSAGLTILNNLNAANASGVIVQYNSALLGPLGINETATYPVGNNGTYGVLLGFK